MKRLYILVMIVFATSISFSREAKKTNITSVKVQIDPSLARDEERQHDGRPLTWDDFKALPDSLSEWGAVTHSGIRLRYEYRKNRDSMMAVVKLLPFMDMNKSWCKPAAMNDYTLAHEQRHFDIAVVIANELAREIEHTDFHLVDFAATIMKLHGKYIERLEAMQRQYDEATQHGDNYAIQLEWNDKIAATIAH